MRLFFLLGLTALGAMANAQASIFNFAEVASSVPYDMRNVNNNGDVYGLLHNSDGTFSGSIYNQATGFHAIGLTDQDTALGGLTNGGYMYTRNSSNFDASPIYRTQIGGTKSAIDLTNGGAVSLSAGISNTWLNNDDRLVFQTGTHFYVWTQGAGSVFLGDNLQNINFANNGSYIVQGPTGLARLNSDGTRTAINAPAGTSGLGQLIGYSEKASNTQDFEFLRLDNVNGSQIFVNTSYVIPAGQSTGYSVSFGQQFLSGIPQPPYGLRILNMNQAGFAPVIDIQNNFNKLINQPSFDVTDTNGVVQTNNLVRGDYASENYIIGRATGTGIGTNVQVLSHYSGTPGNVPEPASLAVLGIGALALVRRRKIQG